MPVRNTRKKAASSTPKQPSKAAKLAGDAAEVVVDKVGRQVAKAAQPIVDALGGGETEKKPWRPPIKPRSRTAKMRKRF